MINYIFLISSIMLVILNANYVYILRSKNKKIDDAKKVYIYFNYILALISFVLGIYLILGGK